MDPAVNGSRLEGFQARLAEARAGQARAFISDGGWGEVPAPAGYEMAPPASPLAIRAAEVMVGGRFADDLREFYSSWNGGRLLVTGTGRAAMTFHSVWGMISETRRARGLYPGEAAGLVMITGDGCGNWLGMAVRNGPPGGAVYDCGRELPGWHSRPVASSLDEFLSRLHDAGGIFLYPWGEEEWRRAREVVRREPGK